MRRSLEILLLIVAGVCNSYGQAKSTPSLVPKEGFVPDAKTALAVGEAVLMPVFGEQTVVSERPFKATLKGDVWIVTGSVKCDGPPGVPCPGGAAEVRISKRSGQILYMIHYQ